MNPQPERLSTPAASEPLEIATTEALDGEELRSEDWVRMARALDGRRQRIERDMHDANSPHERDTLSAKLEEIDEQIQALSEEASISRFVEDAVKFSYEVRRLNEG